ncbi:MMPL family transporter [Alpinimonas psychrophila]|uniref:RND superfamily putative drug exporter n=1 Tax=Alpinimonas psychrophila TaxID=748908 RepID=A0A7W3PNX6_9MICO|nr:MMPL family transporter [Alpinimonas psychrophila]MBA8828648.1 RND superfamily putative drug exporter [Alpinimonas psychrophila]
MTVLGVLARISTRYRWVVVIAWALLVLGALFGSKAYGGTFSNDLTLAGTDSQAAYDQLRSEFPELAGDGMQVLVHSNDANTPVTSVAIQSEVEVAVSTISDIAGVAAIRSPYNPQMPMVSEDGLTALVTIQFTERAKDIPAATIAATRNAFNTLQDAGVEVEFGGPATQTESGPSGSEMFGLLAAAVVLLLVFGSLFAMLVTLITALTALGIGIASISILASSVTIGTSGPIVAAMIGLGVGIDYALLIVTRHRDGMSRGLAPKDSIEIAMKTAGRSVLVAGLTVIIAILSLYVIGIPFVSSLGLASAIVVGAIMLAAVTLLPALLAIFGTKLDSVRVRKIGNRASAVPKGRGDISSGMDVRSGWRAWVSGVQKYRWIALFSGVMVLMILAVPLLSLRLGTADGGSQSAETTQRKAYDLIVDGFGAGWAGPLLVTADFGSNLTPEQLTAASMVLRTDLVDTAGVASVTPPRLGTNGTTVLYTVIPTTSPDAAETETLVHDLRESVLPMSAPNVVAHVGGATATSIDLADTLLAQLGWFVLLVVGLAFIVLLIEFKAPFIAAMAVIMNLFAVGAAYGPVVAVFQWGWWPADLLGVIAGPVESFVPVMLFAVLFGLSTDYTVFLLSRVKEELSRDGNTQAAVRNGLAATAKVILAAASVMVVVFGSFMLNDQRTVTMFGFGLAISIAVYTLVVMLLVIPAVLAIAGRAAWWKMR